MMDWIRGHKMLSGFLAVSLLAAGGYFIFSGGGGTPSGSLSREDVTAPTQQEGDRQLVQLLLRVREISLNEEFFQNEAFNQLQSTAQPLPQRGAGRNNPFAPLPPSQQ